MSPGPKSAPCRSCGRDGAVDRLPAACGGQEGYARITCHPCRRGMADASLDRALKMFAELDEATDTTIYYDPVVNAWRLMHVGPLIWSDDDPRAEYDTGDPTGASCQACGSPAITCRKRGELYLVGCKDCKTTTADQDRSQAWRHFCRRRYAPAEVARRGSKMWQLGEVAHHCAVESGETEKRREAQRVIRRAMELAGYWA